MVGVNRLQPASLRVYLSESGLIVELSPSNAPPARRAAFGRSWP